MTSVNNEPVSHTRNIAKRTTIVGFMTFISRILGFVRDMVCAVYLGAGANYDAFLVAFKIPNFLRRLFAEGAFAQAFVPILSEYRETKSKAAVLKLLQHVFGVLSTILLVVSVLGMLAAPWVIRAFAPGFDSNGPRLYLAVDLLRITFPYIFFISLTAFLGSVLNSYDKFSAPAVAPVLLNITMIMSILGFAHQFAEPVTALAWGVFAGGIVQLLFLIFFVWKIDYLPRPAFHGDREGVTRIMKNMVPALFGVSVAQISLLFDTIFSSFLPKGSISWLYYSDRLMEFPLGVFGVALSTVVLPHLSRQHATNKHKDFELTVDWTLQLILLIVLPASLGLFVLADELIITLFNYGKFTIDDVLKSAMSLRAFACGLVAFVSIKILASANYARKDIKTPVKIAMLCMVVNILLSLILMQFLQHVGLALAGTITGFLNAALLLMTLIKKDIYKPVLEWKVFSIRVLLANLILVILIKLTSPHISEWIAWSSWQRASVLMVLISIAMIAYFGFLQLSGFNFKKQLTLG